MSNLSIPGERGIIEPSAISSQPIDCLKAESCKRTAYIFFWPGAGVRGVPAPANSLSLHVGKSIAFV